MVKVKVVFLNLNTDKEFTRTFKGKNQEYAQYKWKLFEARNPHMQAKRARYDHDS